MIDYRAEKTREHSKLGEECSSKRGKQMQRPCGGCAWSV